MGLGQTLLDAGGRLYCWGNREPILTIRRVLWVRPPAAVPCMHAVCAGITAAWDVRCLWRAPKAGSTPVLRRLHIGPGMPLPPSPPLLPAGPLLWLGAGRLLLDLRPGHAAVHRVRAILVAGRHP